MHTCAFNILNSLGLYSATKKHGNVENALRIPCQYCSELNYDKSIFALSPDFMMQPKQGQSNVVHLYIIESYNHTYSHINVKYAFNYATPGALQHLCLSDSSLLAPNVNGLEYDLVA